MKDLKTPENIRIFDEGGGLVTMPPGKYQNSISKDFSKFACSSTFKILSNEGAKEMHKIAIALKVPLHLK